jgi:hypothetical protein
VQQRCMRRIDRVFVSSLVASALSQNLSSTVEKVQKRAKRTPIRCGAEPCSAVLADSGASSE